jgi:nucleoside-diphosphate kinase
LASLFYKFQEFTVERTFIAIKPDGVQRGLVGEIIRRLETKGFTLVALKLLHPSRELAEQHYAVHKERPFFSGLVDFITVAASRLTIGATNPLVSPPGTIRGDLGINIGRNLIHGSDAVETAQSEIALWFKQEELVSWTQTVSPWLSE